MAIYLSYLNSELTRVHEESMDNLNELEIFRGVIKTECNIGGCDASCLMNV
jgi:hypothetical protein